MGLPLKRLISTESLELHLWYRPDMGWSFHYCGGKAHREFVIGDHYEEWVWCTECGDWYLAMVANLSSLAKLDLRATK